MNKKNAYTEAVDWFRKIAFLRTQIDNLEKLKDAPIIAISVFLLKSQLIEFELKQLITTLDLHLAENNSSKDLRRKIRTPFDFEKNFTLGRLVSELKSYEGEILSQLINDLNKLVTTRNSFTHKLFSVGTVDDLTNNAKLSLPLANKVISRIEEVNKTLKD